MICTLILFFDIPGLLNNVLLKNKMILKISILYFYLINIMKLDQLVELVLDILI